MKLTVVGFWGAYPEVDSATSCYLLEKDGYQLLLDCGSGALAQLPKYTTVMDLDAVFVSHYHQDHIADLGVLQYHFLVQNAIHHTKKVLPIYGHCEDEKAFAKLNHQATKGMAYFPNERVDIGPLTITFLRTKHPVPCYAMRITDGESTVVYTADSSYQDTFIPFAKNADLFITDCSFYKGQNATGAGHMTSEESAIIAKKACVSHLLLSHHPHFGDRKQLKKEAASVYQGKINLAESGFQWQPSSS
ncbi:Ribonuclease BN [Paraliobacillus sp. PM-2]|uniref:MBL fold metallo-hydrolase n=1 Tax=Paraliobacillus sp. PM-2 TaxID=1462524 RepID=UPI00061B92CA|nr:MBL fold metallo-hydrolase [Paraliobacillus sp. PM-2]CQR47023.1 Ribonuclease BN [Paraliobacillus sp. PM-2]